MPDLTELYREAFAAIREALDVPTAALGHEHEFARSILLQSRADAVLNAASALARLSSEAMIREEIEHLKARVDQTPVTYRQFIAAAGVHPDDGLICGPGCCSPVLGVHMSCPGPAVGRTAVSVR